jgi:hypothetical protein
MEPTNSGTGTKATGQNVAAKPPTQQGIANPSNTQNENRAAGQEMANFSPPGSQANQPGGYGTTNNS